MRVQVWEFPAWLNDVKREGAQFGGGNLPACKDKPEKLSLRAPSTFSVHVRVCQNGKLMLQILRTRIALNLCVS
jgi:hypothetical protein